MIHSIKESHWKFDGWTYTKVHICFSNQASWEFKDTKLREVRAWLDESGIWYENYPIVVFGPGGAIDYNTFENVIYLKSDSDATLFKLRWGGDV